MSRLDQVTLRELMDLGAEVHEDVDRGFVTVRIPEDRYTDEAIFIVTSLPYNGWDPRPSVFRTGGFVVVEGYVD